MLTLETAENIERSRPQLTDFLQAPFASMPAEALLSYFQNRTQVHYFPLSPGKPEHVPRAERIVNHEFSLNNETYRLNESFNWQTNPSRDLEWLILLHKFYYAKDLACAFDYTGNEVFAEKWMHLLSTWMQQTPVGFIDSQVTGRRLQQWLLAYHYFVPKCRSKSITPEFLLAFIDSINSQTRYLCRHLTPEGNHRTIELYAIFVVAVIFPEFQDSLWYLEFALQELVKNMQHDFLSDGVHRELSTDYHHIVLKNFLRIQTLASANEIELPSAFEAIIEKALQFSMFAHKPNGFIPAINDGDSNSYLSLLKKAHAYYPSPERLFVATQGKQGTPPAQRSRGFSDSGYYVMRSNWAKMPFEDAHYLFFDCASLGFGSHGHYDLLNFEMAAYGHSLVVDPGRFTYSENSSDDINWRRIFKSTAYHNTVVIDGKDQIPYRCDRPTDPEPKALLKEFITTDNFDFLTGQAISNEYPVVHERMIFFAAQDYWIVNDSLQGDDAPHRYDLYFHLSPEAQDRTEIFQDAECIVISSPHLLIAQPTASNTVETAIEDGFVSPEYGIKQKAPIIKFSQSSSVATGFRTVLFPYRTMAPTLRVEELNVYRNGRLCSQTAAVALKISIENETFHGDDFFFIADEPVIEDSFFFGDISCCARLLYIRRDYTGRILDLQGVDLNHQAIDSEKLRHHLEATGESGRHNTFFSVSLTRELTLDNSRLLPDGTAYRAEGMPHGRR